VKRLLIISMLSLAGHVSASDTSFVISTKCAGELCTITIKANVRVIVTASLNGRTDKFTLAAGGVYVTKYKPSTEDNVSVSVDKGNV